MLRPWCTVVLGLAVAAGAAAQEGGAPLSGTRQELQELRERQKASAGPDVKDGLKSAVPGAGFSPSLGDAAPVLPRPTPESLETERRQREKTRQNWLLNGMSRLEKEANDAAGRTAEPIGATGAEEETGRIDTSDPAYLLKLYDQQKKVSENKTAPPSGAAARASDPLAPFLQNWLADSPVRDQALAHMVRPSGGGDPNLGIPGARPPTGAGAAGPSTIGANRPTVAGPNPYLADTPLTPVAPPPLSAPSQTPSGPPLSPVLTPVTGLPAGTTLTPSTEPPPAPRRVAPPPPADDKKYFPQLKKF